MRWGYKMRTCQECKWCVQQDHGYSNYTVEGTHIECRKKVHPDGDFDRFYGTDERIKFAEKCTEFSEGGSIEMDVDRENYDTLTDEQKLIFDDGVRIKG